MMAEDKVRLHLEDRSMLHQLTYLGALSRSNAWGSFVAYVW